MHRTYCSNQCSNDVSLKSTQHFMEILKMTLNQIDWIAKVWVTNDNENETASVKWNVFFSARGCCWLLAHWLCLKLRHIHLRTVQWKMFYCSHFCMRNFAELNRGIKKTWYSDECTMADRMSSVVLRMYLWCEVHNHNIYKPLFQWQTIQLQ